MTCSKIGVSILVIAILVLTLSPGILSSESTKWVIIISSVLIAIIVWAGTVCKCNLIDKPNKK